MCVTCDMLEACIENYSHVYRSRPYVLEYVDHQHANFLRVYLIVSHRGRMHWSYRLVCIENFIRYLEECGYSIFSLATDYIALQIVIKL